ncbi:D-amino-acid:oxygen oxidoreductase (deaminating) [Antricoccus suffuscus]|uniref:D-amino-acid oxidase n=1 Tax=Antricoccus suffuscus TaxID=1629062 RepID=A0A2T0ZW32_9ACTN|nr:FAD-dependent oxidoreductase [Antricoccus suffuscus]PRZ40533.1 D-amino-acid:oxygen oxidoreductase (deaminating) [Antricoccus suffuscus]
MSDVLVLGSGVIGLTTAIGLVEAGHQVLVRTRELPEATTSAVAGALCGPLIPSGDERLDRWARTSDKRFRELAVSASDVGVRIARGRLVSNFGDEFPPWAADIPGFVPCAGEDKPDGYTLAFWSELPIVDMRIYLRYLTDRYAAAGGLLEVNPVASLSEAAASASIVVNCTGVAARDLADDPLVRPVKGMHVVVANPGIDDFFFEGGTEGQWTSYVSHRDHVLLGGISLEGDSSREPDPAVAEQIRARCIRIEPRLGEADVLGIEVGSRPARDPIRLEEATIGSSRVIHHYGHGGVGVMLSWGGAADVVDMCR